MTPLNAMKQALEELELSKPAYIQECYERHDNAIANLRTAIAELESAESVVLELAEAYEVANDGRNYANRLLTEQQEEIERLRAELAHLAQSRDSIIEECAAILEQHDFDEAYWCAERLRALKGK